MSFSDKLSNSINKVINEFLDCVVTKYGMNKTDLEKLWAGKFPVSGSTTKKAKPPVSTSPKKSKPSSKKKKTETSQSETKTMDDTEDLSAYTAKELKEMCREKGLKVSGKKADLIARLSGKEESKSSKEEKKRKPKSTKSNTIVDKLLSKVPSIAIRKNNFGNYEHPETHLVFNNNDKKVIGHQEDDGTVSELTQNDIEMCKKFKFAYEIPNNLESGTDVKVDGLDDELEEIDGSDEEVEIEEDEDDQKTEDINEDDQKTEDINEDELIDDDEIDIEEEYLEEEDDE